MGLLKFKSLIKYFIVYAFAIFYGILGTVFLLVQRIRKGKEFFVVKERPLPPKCLTDKVYGRHHNIRLKDGINIHYVENGDETKPMMLFVHGFPEFWFSWRNQLKHFAKTHWVVALDMRGYGDSDKPDGISAYKTEILESDIYNFVHALSRDKCILVGHDWGAIVSYGVAARYPNLVEKLIIMNGPHLGAFSKKLHSSLKQFFKSWYGFSFQVPYLAELIYSTEDMAIFGIFFDKPISAEHLEAYKYNWGKKGAWTPPINYYRSVMHTLINTESYQRIVVPTLVIWGTNDIALERDLAEMSKEFVQNIRIEYIEDATHFVQNHKTDEVNRIMDRFLKI